MTPSQLKLNFSKIKTATVLEKSLLFRLFVLIPAFPLLWTAAIFTIIYLTGESITFYGVDLYPGDPGYALGYYRLVAWLVGVAILWIAVLGAAIANHRPVTHWLAIDYEQNPYVYMRAKRHEILATSAFVFDFDRRSGAVRVSSDPAERERQFARACFWLDPREEGEWTIRQTDGALKVRIVEPDRWSKRIRSYRVRYDAAGTIASCVETVSVTSAGNSNLKRWVKLTYLDVNRHSAVDVRPEIRRELAERQIIL